MTARDLGSGSALSRDILVRPLLTDPNPVRIGPWIGALALIAALVPLHTLWFVQGILLLLLLVLPGAILLRALRVPGRVVASFPAYIPCASIALLFAVGLTVDFIGNVIGVHRPLGTWTLLLGLELICLALLLSSKNAPTYVNIPWSSLQRPMRFLWPLVLPIAAAFGALRLNNGRGSFLAVAALAGTLAVLLFGIIRGSRLDKLLLAVILYSAELAMMWAYSLRGDLVYGYDISTEYHDLMHTVLTGNWHMNHSGDAYGAMMSVTVLPGEIHFIAGIPPLLVFKLAYPAISALFPVAIFELARAIVPRRWSFAAAASFVAQGAFAQELPGVARQEIALVLFAGLMMATLDTRITRRAQWTLVALLAAAMVLAHYSTTYVAITLLIIVLVLQFLISWIRDIPHVTGSVGVGLLVTILGAVIWYGPVTHSTASGLTQLGQSLSTQGLNVLPNQSHGEGVIAAYLQGNSETPMPAVDYAHMVATYYKKTYPFIHPLPSSSEARYALHDDSAPAPDVRLSLLSNVVSLGSLLVSQLMNLFGAVGAILLVLRKKSTDIARQLGLLALATVFLLVLIRLSGTLAEAYNQDRALMQAMAVLAIALGWSLREGAAHGRRAHRIMTGVSAVAVSVFFMATSGLLAAVLGGGTATNLSNSGEDFERFYMTDPELTAAQWLGEVVRPGQLVYADRYAQLPLVAMTGITNHLINDVTPMTLNQSAWIYGSRSNVVEGRARADFEGHDVTYTFPARFIESNYDLVYANGSSEVFHR